MKCQKCNEENRDGSRFCRFCGAVLEPAVETSAAAPGAPAVEEQAPAPVVDEIVEEEPAPVLMAAETPQDAVALADAETVSQAELVTEITAAPPADSPLEQASPAVAPPEPPRYAILRAETSPEGEKIYQVEDRRACLACGAFQTDPQPHFCEMCGAELSAWPMVQMVEAADGESAETVKIEDNFYRLLAAASATDPASAVAAQSVRLAYGCATDTGTQREINEDSLLAIRLTALCQNQPAPEAAFFAVADGIGGHEAGEVASRAAVQALGLNAMQTLFGPLLQDEPLPWEALQERVKAVVYSANLRLLNLRYQAGANNNMGCTLAAALIRDHQAILVNVGDSRVYLMRQGTLAQISKDHSLVAQMVENGQLTDDEAQHHPQKNVITRSLGDKPDLEVDLFPVDLGEGDRLLLCSDGLWEMLTRDMIEEVLLSHHDPQSACNTLVQLANQAGGDDNISVVIISLQSIQ